MYIRRTPSRIAVLVILALVLQPPATARQQQPQEPDSLPTFRTGVNTVRVDVIVTGEDGRPVEDLTMADFEVREDGQTQAIDQFQVVRTGHLAAQGPAPQPIRTLRDEEYHALQEEVGLFLIYFQHEYIDRNRPGSPSPIEKLRRHRAFLLGPLIAFVRSLPPADMVAVADPVVPPGTAMFTRDREATIRAMEDHFDEQLWARRSIEMLNGNRVLPPRRQFEDIEAASIRLTSLRETRQTLVLVGAGLGGPRLALNFVELVALLKRNNTAVSVIDTEGLDPPCGSRHSFGGADPCQKVSMINREANLRGVTEATGGYAIVNTNELAAGLAPVAAEGRVYYLLTYTSPAPADGQFHEISVKVRRSGVNVRARSGYRAFTADEMRRILAGPPKVDPAVVDALADLPVLPGAERPISTWIGTERHGAGARVTLAWEPRPTAPDERRQPVERVTLVAKSPDGAVLFEGVSAVPRAARSATTRGMSGPSQLSFEAPPGEIYLQLAIESPDGVADRNTFTVTVPDYAADPTAVVSTPKVFRARTEPERRALLADREAAPTAIRQFARTERLIVQFAMYGDEGPPRAALLSRRGDALHDIDVVRTGPEEHHLHVRLNHLAAGEYVIEIRWGRGEDARALVPFRVK